MTKKRFILLCLAVNISACGGGGGGEGGGSPAATTTLATTINSFSVTGSAIGTGGQQELNANMNSGKFTVDWNVSSSNPYRVDLYVSNDSTFDKATDKQFFGQNCGSGPLLNCTATANFDCKFTTLNKISCGVISGANPEIDLTTFLTALPMSAYIIIEACDGLITSCKNKSVLVEFQ